MLAIRIARPADHAAIEALCAELSAHEGVEPPNFRAEHLTRFDFMVCIVATMADEVVGYALCYPGFWTQPGAAGLHMEDLVVTARHRRQGIGRALIAAVAAESRRIGGSWITWGVKPDNHSAIAFYESLGAKRESPTSFDLWLEK